MKRFALVAAGLLATFLTAVMRPALAGAQNPADSPYMVNVGPQLPGQVWNQNYQAIFANARDAGVRWGFIFVTWSDLERLPGVIDWSGLDAVVTSAHSNGINLVLQVQSTGDWGLSTPAQILASGGYRTNLMHPILTPKTAAPLNIDAALGFWSTLVNRYRPHGGLASALGWSDGYGIENYEVENEPDFIPWVNGSWQTVTKDYALFLSHLAPAVKAIDPAAHLLGPALSGVDSDTSGPIPNTGLTWLETLLNANSATLSFASDQYRQAGMAALGAGPFIDVFSFHCDLVDPTTEAHTQRAAAVRQIIANYNTQPDYPTNSAAPAWCSEGGATGYDSSDSSQQYRFAWAQIQFAAEMLGAGVPRFDYDFGFEAADPAATWSGDQMRAATLALTTYFPSGRGVTATGIQLSALAGQTVVGYQWTDPATNLKSNVLWAQDEPSGSGSSQAPFSFALPVASAQVLIIDPHSWSRSVLNAVRGSVAITLNRADPSPPYMAIECPAAGCR